MSNDWDAMAAAQAAQLGDLDIQQSIWGNSLPDTRRIDRTRDEISTTRTGTRASLGRMTGGIGSTPERYAKAANETITVTDTARQPRYADSLLKSFYLRSRTDPEGFVELQKKLFMGGFYAPNTKFDKIQAGVPDDYTLDAYYQLLKTTMRYNESGADVTVEELLDERIGSMTDEMRNALYSGGGGSGRIVQLTDPTAVGQALDQIAKQTVGRKATADEQRMFLTAFHAMQSAAQSAESGTVAMPDLGAQAEQAMRDQNPAEAGAHDMANTFQSFLGLLGGLGK